VFGASLFIIPDVQFAGADEVIVGQGFGAWLRIYAPFSEYLECKVDSVRHDMPHAVTEAAAIIVE